MSGLLSRSEFRNICLERDNHTCCIPWCDSDADEVHHVLERSLWDDGGYYERNGASVCNMHHRYAESNDIPPQAFWRWLSLDPLTPDYSDDRLAGFRELWHSEDTPADAELTDIWNTDKWGEPFERPPWEEHRDTIKYQSSRHFPFSHESDRDDTKLSHRELEHFTEVPLVATIKMDGANAALVKDMDEPVRARNGSHAQDRSFDMLKQLYWENDLYETIPEHLQVFGEWLFHKHSIHYGCPHDGCAGECEDTADPLRSYFQVFGVFDTRYNLWLSWHETQHIAKQLGFPTTPQLSIDADDSPRFTRVDEVYSLHDVAKGVVRDGHEGIVVRSKFPFHFGQFSHRLGKYVREGHVENGETHWSLRERIENAVVDD